MRKLNYIGWLALCITMSIHGALQAKNIGRYGPVHPIKEQDFLEYIQETLLKQQASGELQKKIDTARNKVIEGIEQPVGILLPQAEEKQVHYFDPSIIVQQDIMDHKGNVVVKRGTKVNPLEKTIITKKMIFFDGMDEAQSAYILNVAKKDIRVIPIMVRGRPLDMMRDTNQRMYFDQHQILIKRFGVNQLPTWVVQEGVKMRVESVPLEMIKGGT